MLQTGGHRHHFAAPQQEKVDGILNLENVEIDQEIGIVAELRALAALERTNCELKVFEGCDEPR